MVVKCGFALDTKNPTNLGFMGLIVLLWTPSEGVVVRNTRLELARL
jgi:hypothetical protein